MRILSGIQPSGILHLGNYFGMMKPAIELQEKGEAYYFIADYHALTTVDDSRKLKECSWNVALDFFACGLDPEKVVFFRQSDVPEIHELAWYLSVVTPVGLLERCHSYKDKIARGISPNHALFAYPVLMAADILMYDSDIVPVGQDQKQHLEVTRDVAMKFNERFGETFKIPEPYIRESTATLPGVDGQKMSKSYGNTIEIFEEEKSFRKKVMSIKTDSTPVEDPKPLEGSVILEWARCVGSSDQISAMEESMKKGGVGYGDYKKELFEMLWAYFEDFRKKREELQKDPAVIEGILKRGAEQARQCADKTLARVREAIGTKR